MAYLDGNHGFKLGLAQKYGGIKSVNEITTNSVYKFQNETRT